MVKKTKYSMPRVLDGSTIVQAASCMFSLWRAGYIPFLNHVGFVVEIAALGQVFLQAV
jgi:hypothetical protein